jgi:hypothetical protein
LYGMGGIYKSREQRLVPLMGNCRKLLYDIAKRVGGVHMIHVKSHQGEGKSMVFNDQVDVMAKSGAKMEGKQGGNYVLMDGFAFRKDVLDQLPPLGAKAEGELIAQLLSGQNTHRGIKLPVSSMQPNWAEVKAKVVALVASGGRGGVVLKDEAMVASLVEAIVAKRRDKRKYWTGLRVIPADPSQPAVVLSPDTKLVDIPMELLGGALALLHKSELFYNKKMLRLIAEVYLKVLQEMQQVIMGGGVRMHQEVLAAFKKWFLINPILATEDGDSDDHESVLQHRCQLLLADKWDSFVIKDMRLRPQSIYQQPATTMPISALELEDREMAKRESRANKAMSVGEVGVAVKVICDSLKPAEVDESTLIKLRELFPHRVHVETGQPRAASVTEEQGNDPIWQGPQITEDDIPRRCEMTDLFMLLHKTSRMVAPGLDGMRYNHLRYIVSLSEHEQPVYYGVLKGLTWLVNVYLEGILPVEINRLLSEAEIFPLAKKTGGIRPIMMVNSLRKIAANYGTKQFESLNEKVFGNLQLGIQREFGMEAIIHTFTQLLKDKPHLDFVFADFKNAFNVVDRQRMLNVVEEKFGDLHKFFKACYGTDMHAWVCGEEGAHQIRSSEGVHQGDPLGCIGFALAVHCLFERVLELCLQDEGTPLNRGTAKAYIDDLSTAATFDNSTKIIDLLLQEGSQYGIVLNFDKTIVLMGKCGSWEEAQWRQSHYCDRGMKWENVIIHPDDVLPNDKMPQSLRYGVSCLGVPIGSTDFVGAWLQEKMCALRAMADSITSFNGTKQSKLLMMRFSFAQKITYLLRTIEPDVVRIFAGQFNNLKVEMLCKLLEIRPDELSPMHKKQMLTHLRDGGFGLFDAVESSAAAYMASVRASWKILREVSPALELEVNFNWFEDKGREDEGALFQQWVGMENIKEIVGSRKWIGSFVRSIHEVGRLGGANKPSLYKFFTEEDSFKKLQKVLYTPIRARRLESMKKDWPSNVSRLRYLECIGNGEDASAWLEAFPRSPKLALGNEDFRITCMMRLGLSFPEIIDAAQQKGGRFNYKCPLCSRKCLDRGDVDCLGHHLAHGCRFNNTQSITHNALRDELEAMHKSEGKSVSKEVTLTPIDRLGNILQENVASGESQSQSLSATTTPVSNNIGSNNSNRVSVFEKREQCRADLVVRGPVLTIVEVTVTDPTNGKDESQVAVGDSAAMSQVESRANAKIKKYKDAKAIVDGYDGRALVVFCFSTFGRLNAAGFRYIKDMAKDKDRKGYEAVRFRQYWFQRLSCALQRNLAMQFRNNLMVFRGDIVQGKYSSDIVSSMDYLENGHVRNGLLGSNRIGV